MCSEFESIEYGAGQMFDGEIDLIIRTEFEPVNSNHHVDTCLQQRLVERIGVLLGRSMKFDVVVK